MGGEKPELELGSMLETELELEIESDLKPEPKVEPELERWGTMWVDFGDGVRIGWRSMQRWNKSWG